MPALWSIATRGIALLPLLAVASASLVVSYAATAHSVHPDGHVKLVWGLAWAVAGAWFAVVVLDVGAFAGRAPTNTAKPRATSTGTAANTPQPTADTEGHAFLRRTGHALAAYCATLGNGDAPVVKFASPAALRRRFAAAGVPLDLNDASRPLLHEGAGGEGSELDEALALTLDLSVRNGHPLFCNQLSGPVDMVAVAGDWVAAAACAPVHTFEVSPVFHEMERSVLRRLREVVGGDFGTAGDGIMLPGGSTCNAYSVVLARFVATEGAAKTDGVQGARGGRLVGFVSADAHYSWAKAFNLCGLGTDAMIKVPTNTDGAMDTVALESAIREATARGDRPFLVVATSGTTVIGGFDDVVAAADVRDRYNRSLRDGTSGNPSLPPLFLAVDACWGGAALFHPSLRERTCVGIERADAVAVDLHKLLGATQQCAALLVRKAGLLAAANSSCANYLFQTDKNHADCDLGDLTLTCGRRADAVKAWFMWKARGEAGLHARVDHAVKLLDFAQRLMGGTPGHHNASGRGDDGGGDDTVRDAVGHPVFVVLSRSPFNLCFYAVPSSLRPLEAPDKWPTPGLATPPGADPVSGWWQVLDQAAPTIKDDMQRRGCGLVGYQPVRSGLPQCFRLVVPGARESGFTQQAHIRQLLRDFQRAADKL